MKRTADVATGQSSAMVQCWCGDVFQASGSTASVDRTLKQWQARHTDCVEPPRAERKVLWVSFTDATRPKGQQFLGACLLTVTAAEAEDAAIDVLLRCPFVQRGAEWIAAAVKQAHRLGCNPGGAVASREIPPDHPMLARYQFGVLMDRATIARIDQDIDRADLPGEREG